METLLSQKRAEGKLTLPPRLYRANHKDCIQMDQADSVHSTLPTNAPIAHDYHSNGTSYAVQTVSLIDAKGTG